MDLDLFTVPEQMVRAMLTRIALYQDVDLDDPRGPLAPNTTSKASSTPAPAPATAAVAAPAEDGTEDCCSFY